MVLDENEAQVFAQAKLISKLNREMTQMKLDHAKLLKKNQELVNKINELQVPADYYLNLQRAILSSTLLQSEWTRFLTFLKMAPDTDSLEELK